MDIENIFPRSYNVNASPSKECPSIPAIAVRCVLTASSHFISHRPVDSGGHLADADLWTEYRANEVADHALLNLHDALQAQAPPHEKADGAYVECQPSAAAPTPQGFPEGADSTDRIAVGDAYHGATDSLNSHPFVIEAREETILEVFSA